MKVNKKAFTLVELIVVITILTILGTIAFISLQGYSANSRDSVRIHDLSNIETALGVYEINAGKFPLPSSYSLVTYSGVLLWNQGSFGKKPFTILGSLSKIPKDPLYDIEYNYSLLNNNTKFQLFSIIEGGIYSNNIFIEKSLALGVNGLVGYVVGNYSKRDILVKENNNCTLISIPSLSINNLPSDGDLNLSTDYNFVYSNSTNISSNYTDKINNTFIDTVFQIKEVQNGCVIDNIDELNLYISKISLLYQQLVGNSLFDEVIYNFNTTTFRRGIIDNLIDSGIYVNPELIAQVLNPSLGNIFRDTFTGIDSVDISINHTPDTFGNWSGDTSYSISSNQLIKTLNSNGFLSINPVLPVTSIDRTILLDIVDFNLGDLNIYSQYTDTNNYVRLKLNSSGFVREKKIDGILSNYDTISVTIPNNSSIEFGTVGDKISLLINNIDQGNIVDVPLPDNSPTTLQMSNGVKIDNFILIYK